MAKLKSRCKTCGKIFNVDRSVMKKPTDDPRILHLRQELNDNAIIRLGDRFETIREDKKMKVRPHTAEISVDDFGRPLRIPLKFSLKGQARKIEDGSRRFLVKNYVTIVPSNSKGDKVAILEELKFDDGSEELRLGYYIIGHKGRVKGRWAWGQYALFIPPKDLIKLIEKGKEKGIL